MNRLFSATSCVFLPPGHASSLISNIRPRLAHQRERGNSSASSHWTFISTWPQAHRKQGEKMKRWRMRSVRYYILLWIIYPSPRLCQSPRDARCCLGALLGLEPVIRQHGNRKTPCKQPRVAARRLHEHHANRSFQNITDATSKSKLAAPNKQ